MITREMLTKEQWEKRHAYLELYHAIHRVGGIEPFVDKTKFDELTPAEFNIVLDTIEVEVRE